MGEYGSHVEQTNLGDPIGELGKGRILERGAVMGEKGRCIEDKWKHESDVLF